MDKDVNGSVSREEFHLFVKNELDTNSNEVISDVELMEYFGVVDDVNPDDESDAEDDDINHEAQDFDPYARPHRCECVALAQAWHSSTTWVLAVHVCHATCVVQLDVPDRGCARDQLHVRSAMAGRHCCAVGAAHRGQRTAGCRPGA